jgi:membrane protease YdiL (CAAX protease family)
MIALLLLLCVPVVMWIGQSVLLITNGLPVRWRLDARDAPRSVRTLGRIITQCSLLAVIVIYPLLRHQNPLAYYADLLPKRYAAADFLGGFAAAVFFLGVLFVACILSDCMVVELHESRRRLRKHLFLLLPIALSGAFVEEPLFRGVVMADLMHSWPSRPAVAVIGSTIIFAAAHYVRKVKRKWTVAGHIMLGLMLSVAFWRTGNLWLASGLHAGGNFMILGARPLITNEGPGWISGASIFPYAGAVGVIGLGLLSIFIATHY